MFHELDTIVLTTDLPAHGLKAGDVGTVVLVHAGGGYEVEFCALNGDTVLVTSFRSEQLRPVAPGEIPHARLVTS